MTVIRDIIFKTCTKCHREFDNQEEFRNLTSFVGIIETGKYSEWNLELRNCLCGTTLAHNFPKDPSKPDELKSIKTEPKKKIA